MLQIVRSLVRFQMVPLEIFFDIKSFRSHNGPGVDSASIRNEYQGYFLGVKAARCVRLKTLPPSCAVVMKSGNLKFLETSGPLLQWGRDFPPVQTGPGAHPASCKMGTGSFLGVKCGRGVLLTTHPLLVPRSRKSRAIPLLTLWAT